MRKNSSKKPTIEDIARDLGISKTTVSRSLSGKGRIGEETRRRVLDYMKQLNYQPNMIAKGLAQSKTYNIGVVYPSDYSTRELDFFQKCLVGIVRSSKKADYDVLLIMVSNTDISHLKRVINHHKVDGLILLRVYQKDSALHFLKDYNLPVVTVGSTEEDFVSQVDNDNQKASETLTAYLLDSGLERIALVGGDSGHIVTKSRLHGYYQAFQKKKKSVDSRLLYMDTDSRRMAETCVEDALLRRAECIITGDEILCRWVTDYLEEENINIPGDIRMASFYRSTAGARENSNILALSFDAMELGSRACKNLLQRLSGQEAPKRTLLGFQLEHQDVLGTKQN